MSSRRTGIISVRRTALVWCFRGVSMAIVSLLHQQSCSYLRTGCLKTDSRLLTRAPELLKASNPRGVAVSRQTGDSISCSDGRYEARCIDCKLQTSTDEDIEEVHPAANQQCVVIRACVIRDTSAAVTLLTNDRPCLFLLCADGVAVTS